MGYLGKEPRKDGGSLTLGATLDTNGNEIVLDADADTSITADTDDTIDIKIGGSDIFQMTASKLDLNGKELVLDADADTSITADTDDQIDFKTGGTDRMKLSSAGVLSIPADGGDLTGATNAIHLGASADMKIFHNGGNNFILTDQASQSFTVLSDIVRFNTRDNGESLFGATLDGGFFAKHDNVTAISTTSVSGTDTSINFVANTTNTDPTANNVRGIRMHTTGGIAVSSVSDQVTGDFNRANDGTVLLFRSAGGSEGSISISGSTTSLGSMTGTHWSRLADNSKPTILRGTVMETIDEMVDWYNVEFDKNILYVNDIDDIPDGKKVGDVKETITVQRQIGLLPNGKSVGDTTTYTDEGIEYTGKIVKQADEKHVKTKISDTAECTNVYGVFMFWDEDDDTVNDMNVASLGTMVVRIHKDQTVSKGDLVTSNGDGTAKKQDDDIIRTKTIGKVLTNIKQETYSDGSYTVPCALYCG